LAGDIAEQKALQGNWHFLTVWPLENISDLFPRGSGF
jgi:hypothetical protein